MPAELTDATVIAIAAAWPGLIWAIVEAIKRGLTLPKWLRPTLPLVIGILSGPAVVELMVSMSTLIDSFPALHSLVVGLGAGAFASSIHDTREATK